MGDTLSRPITEKVSERNEDDYLRVCVLTHIERTINEFPPYITSSPAYWVRKRACGKCVGNGVLTSDREVNIHERLSDGLVLSPIAQPINILLVPWTINQ